MSGSGREPHVAPYSWYVVGVLTFAYLVSFLDRQILALMVVPIKADLGLSDTEISLLMGLAFSIFYVTMGIPLGRLADHRSRRAIISVGVGTWSLMTAACGLAGSFGQLFLARIGVGVGEAALTPSAVSMISDYFPRNRRGRAIATYNMGISLGTGFAMVLGGAVVAYVASAPALELPFVGALRGWQYVFLLVALPGLLVLALMMTVREPLRMERLPGDAPVMPLREVTDFLWERRRLYVTLFLGMSVATIIGYAYFSWIPTMFVRHFGWTIPQTGLAYGTVILLAGPAGVLGGGWLIDRLSVAGHADAPARVALLGAVITLPSTLLVALMPSPGWTIAMLVPASIGPAMASAAGSAAVAMVTPNQLRGQTIALYLFTISILGLTIGPTAVAVLTDHLFADERMLHWSIGIVSTLSATFSVIMLGACLRPYRVAVRALLAGQE